MKHLLFFIFVIAFISCQRLWYLKEVNFKLEPINKQLDTMHLADRVDSIIMPYRNQMNTSMSELIGATNFALWKSYPECNLGNWAVDVTFEAARDFYNVRIDIAILNMESLRSSYIDSGNIKLFQLYELMPFDNHITLMQMPGDKLNELGLHMLQKGAWPISKGSMMIKNNTGTCFTQVGGRAFSLDSLYSLALPDYLANGGDGCHFLKAIPRQASNILIRQILVDDIKKDKLIKETRYKSSEGRIII